MRSSWDPRLWKKSTKLLLGFATVWPHVYLLIFFGGAVAITFLLAPNREPGFCGDTGVVQLEQKIRNGELRELVVRPTEIRARNRSGTCEYRVVVRDEYERREILRKAREVGANGEPLVPQISTEDKPPVSPLAVAGFVAVFAVHMLTIVLLFLLVTIYIILVVRNEQFDQTTKIAWIVSFCLVTMIAFPVYWYLYVWREPAVASPGPPPQMTTL